MFSHHRPDKNIYISESFGIFRLDILACPDGTEPVGEILFNHDMRKTLD